ncbi:NACHT domain-containing protein [Streptomyces purpurascens]|uniref:ATP-binding protein n=1 Tax=Streptomyces purpurascens TaxID=1924 RepID=A0ABZ1MIU7_STREF
MQMLAQVHRCAVLRNFDPDVLSPHAAAELERVGRLLDRLNLAPPSCSRFPLWVEAEALAAYMSRATDSQRSLWHFLAKSHEQILNIPVSIDKVRSLVEGRPTLLVLDAYDEVSPQHRKAVIECVMDIADDMQIMRANTAILVTARPQAYEDELRAHKFEAWSLEPLTSEGAERHAAVLVGSDDNGERLLDLFRVARSESAILDLLNTPLHVALLVALLAESGLPPTGRHRLFSRYYHHVYVREQGRGGELGVFLEKYRDLVDELHRRIAFHILATVDEVSSHKGISADSFAKIARSLVHETELAEDDEETDVVHQLIRFARERLVLIVGVDSDKVGFQVKSFTEFLAAAHLVRTSDEHLIRERFRAVAALEQWRNVARFMGAAAFETDSLAERDLRDSIVTVLAELDRKEFAGVDALLLRGAELAIDLLSDVPDLEERYRRHLIPSAQTIEDLDNRNDALAKVAAADFDDRRIVELAGALYAPPAVDRDRNAAWRFLNKLAEHGNVGAAETAREYVHSVAPEVLPQLLWDIAVPQVVTSEELVGLIRQADPNMVRGSSGARDVGLPKGWAASAWQVLHGGSAQLRINVKLEGLWHLSGPRSMRSLQSSTAGLSAPPAECHPHWSAWALVGQVLEASGPGIADAPLRAFADMKDGGIVKHVPWPFHELLAGALPPSAVAVDAWYTAEDRWRESGVSLLDVETYLTHGTLGHRAAVSGFPFGAVHWSLPGRRDTRISTLARDVWDMWHDHRQGHPVYRAHVAENVLLPMCDYALKYEIGAPEPHQVRELIRAMSVSEETYLTFPTVCHALSQCPSDEEFAEIATRVVRWRWSTGQSRAEDPSAHNIIGQAHRLLDENVFHDLSWNIARQSKSSRTWDALTSYWITPANPGQAHWPLAKLLSTQGEPPSRREIARAVAATEFAWDLFEVVENVPFWSDETRAWVWEELLYQAGEPWMVYAPDIWRRGRPARAIPLAALELPTLDSAPL